MSNAPESNAPTDAAAEVAPKRKSAPEAAAQQPEGFLLSLRGYLDALVFAYVLAMFIRTFCFELFMIPTGSMTPTLIGDRDRRVAHLDYDGDGIRDYLCQTLQPSEVLVYLMKENGEYREVIVADRLGSTVARSWLGASTGRTDMILVNKFSYWFSPPKRGDIIVFKVPDRPDQARNPFDPKTPVFIKRCIGLPGEEVTLQPVTETIHNYGTKGFIGRLIGTPPNARERHMAGRPMIVNGKPLEDDSLAARLLHYPPPRAGYPSPRDAMITVKAGDNEVLMFGDNGASSSDSRIWGGVPMDHLRGKAVLRYWPMEAWSFLR